MARQLRICLPDVTYHVFSRCIEQRKLMEPKLFKDIMIGVMESALKKYEFDLISYEIMDNHFHFIIKTRSCGASISTIMQFIKARFAERYNKLNERTGPFWNERFKNTIIEHAEDPLRYLLWLLWYLAFNPVRIGKISDPRDYLYGSINSYLVEDYKPPVKIVLHDYFLRLGETFSERVQRFLVYEEMYRKRLYIGL